MAQKARPDSDVLNTNWTNQSSGTTNIFQAIDEETPSDSDFIKTSNSTNDYRAGLSDVADPESDAGHIIRARGRRAASGNSITVSLYEGTTLIATAFTISDINFTTHTYTLSGSEADAIGDYSNLRLRFVASLSSELGPELSWAEFEVPDPPPETQTLTLGNIASSAQVFNPTLTPGVVELALNFLASSAQVFNLTLQNTKQIITLDFIESSAEAFDIDDLVPGSVELALDAIESSAQVFDTTIKFTPQVLEIDFVESESEVFEPTLEPGSVELALDAIPSGAQAFDINLQYTQELDLDFIEGESEAFDIDDLAPGPVELSLNFLLGSSQVFNIADLAPGPVELSLTTISSSAQAFDINLQYEQSLLLQAIASGAQVFQPELQQGAPELNIAAIPDHTNGSVTILIFNANTSVTNRLMRYVDSQGEESAIQLRAALDEDGTFVDNQAPLGVPVTYFIIEELGAIKSPSKTVTLIPQPKLYFHQTTKTDNETNAVSDVLLLSNLIPQEDSRVRDVGEDSLAAFESPELTGAQTRKRVLRSMIVIEESERVEVMNALWTIFKSKRTVCARDFYGRVIFGTVRSFSPDFRDKLTYLTLEIHQTSFSEAVD